MSTTIETLFAPLTIATAPEAARPVLEEIQKSFGFIPNLMAIFANNPTVLEGYLTLDAAYEKAPSHQGKGRSSCSPRASRTTAITARPHIQQF
jgi:hypothetical protein